MVQLFEKIAHEILKIQRKNYISQNLFFTEFLSHNLSDRETHAYVDLNFQIQMRIVTTLFISDIIIIIHGNFRFEHSKCLVEILSNKNEKNSI